MTETTVPNFEHGFSVCLRTLVVFVCLTSDTVSDYIPTTNLSILRLLLRDWGGGSIVLTDPQGCFFFSICSLHIVIIL